MNKITRKISSKGSSIIELLIATVVVGTIMTAMAVGMTTSIKNSAEVRYRGLAGGLAQDTIEFFRQQREQMFWNDFYGLFPGNSVTTYCFNIHPVTPFSTPEEGASRIAEKIGVCNSTDILVSAQNTFQREVVVTTPSSSSGPIKFDVTVSWNIGGPDEREITVTQIFKDQF
jgi:type II secretory pathway pseudopilin PulG